MIKKSAILFLALLIGTGCLLMRPVKADTKVSADEFLSYYGERGEELEGDVVIPEGVTKIEEHGFRETQFDMVYIPSSVEEIRDFA